MDELRCEIEVRADESRASPGRLYGRLIAYEKRAVDRAEIFAAGSLSWPDDGVVLNLSHDRKQPVVRFVPEVRGSELVVDVPLPDTTRGRDAATMIANGTLRGLSVEFRALREDRHAGVRRIVKARLGGAALVDDASYGNAVELRDKGRRGRKPGRETLWL